MIGTDYIGRCKLYFYLTLPAKPSDDSLGVVVSQKQKKSTHWATI